MRFLNKLRRVCMASASLATLGCDVARGAQNVHAVPGYQWACLLVVLRRLATLRSKAPFTIPCQPLQKEQCTLMQDCGRSRATLTKNVLG